MRYILKYEYESKYFGFIRELEKEFVTMKEVRDFLSNNIHRIHNYKIYKLTNLSDE